MHRIKPGCSYNLIRFIRKIQFLWYFDWLHNTTSAGISIFVTNHNTTSGGKTYINYLPYRIWEMIYGTIVLITLIPFQIDIIGATWIRSTCAKPCSRSGTSWTSLDCSICWPSTNISVRCSSPWNAWSRLDDRLVCWMVDWLVGWSIGCSDDRLVGWMIDWLVGGLIGWRGL